MFSEVVDEKAFDAFFDVDVQGRARRVGDFFTGLCDEFVEPE